jgi:Putative lumazine-binding
MKKNYVLVMFIAFVCSIPLFAFYQFEKNKEVESIKTLIKKSYFNGAFNALDTKAMAEGFHSDFLLYTAKGEELQKLPIKEWIASIEANKAKPDFDAKTRKYEGKIVQVDVTDIAATAKIELSKDGKLIFTDYLSLYKFDSGWKIVGKIYFRHQKS